MNLFNIKIYLKKNYFHLKFFILKYHYKISSKYSAFNIKL